MSTNFNPHLRSGLFSGQNFLPEKKESNFVHKTTRKNFLSFRDVKKFTEKDFLLVLRLDSIIVSSYILLLQQGA